MTSRFDDYMQMNEQGKENLVQRKYPPQTIGAHCSDDRYLRQKGKRASCRSSMQMIVIPAFIVLGILTLFALNIGRVNSDDKGRGGRSSSGPAQDDVCDDHRAKPLRRKDVLHDKHFPQGADVYDFIVVGGAGTAGSLVSNRLARHFPDKRVLVIDVGRDEAFRAEATQCPFDEQTGKLIDPSTCHDFGTATRAWIGSMANDPDKCLRWAYEQESSLTDESYLTPGNGNRGATYGGTSALNFQVYWRGTKVGTWDRMQALLGDEWSFDAMLESFKRIENRNQKTAMAYPPFSPQGETPSFSSAYEPGSAAYFDESIMSRYRGEIPLASHRFAQSAHSQAMRHLHTVFPDRFPEFVDPSTGLYAGASSDALDIDEAMTWAQWTSVDQSAARFRWLAALTNEGADVLVPLMPSAFDAFQYTPDAFTPMTPHVTALGLNANFSAISAAAFMDTIGPFGAFDNVYAPTGVVDDGVVFPLEFARSTGSSSFLNQLAGKDFAKSEPLQNIEFIEAGYVKRLVFGDEVDGGDADRIVGVEYFSDAWDVNRVSRGSKYNTRCNRFTAGEAAAEATADPTRTRRAYARYNVVVSAGSYDTPAILQRSGIGRREDFERLEDLIEQRVELRGVGHHLRDHADVFLQYRSNISAPVRAAFSPIIDTVPILRAKSSPGKPVSDFHTIMFGNTAFTLGQPNQYLWMNLFAAANRSAGVMRTPASILTGDSREYPGTFLSDRMVLQHQYSAAVVEHMASASTGTVLITSSDPTVPPVIGTNFNGNSQDLEDYVDYLADTMIPYIESLAHVHLRQVDLCVDTSLPEEDRVPITCDESNTDLFPVAQTFPDDGGAHFVEWLWPNEQEIYTEYFEPQNGGVPTRNVDRQKLRDYVKRSRFSGWHPTGTAHMGREDRCEAVTDTRARVYGVRGLVVVDGSVFPVSPDVNTQGPIYGAAQRIFEMLCEDLESLGVEAAIECKFSTDVADQQQQEQATATASSARSGSVPANLIPKTWKRPIANY